MIDLSEAVLQQPLQLVGRAIDGLIERGRQMRHGKRGLADGFDLQHALLVVAMGFLAAFVAEVRLHPRDLRSEPAQFCVQGCLDEKGKALATLDIFSGVDLNLHDAFSLY